MVFGDVIYSNSILKSVIAFYFTVIADLIRNPLEKYETVFVGDCGSGSPMTVK